MKSKHLSLFLLVILVITSCSKTPQARESFPDINIPEEKFNKEIMLRDTPEYLNSHINGEILLLQIINLSKTNIIFANDYGLKIFTDGNGEWVEVSNNTYYTGDFFSLPTSDNWPLGITASIMPYIAGLTSPITIRVIAIGHKVADNDQVGAYIDVVINP